MLTVHIFSLMNMQRKEKRSRIKRNNMTFWPSNTKVLFEF